MADIKKPLMGMSLYELKEVAKSLGMPAFTGGQMAKWLYTQHVTSIDEMTKSRRPIVSDWLKNIPLDVWSR